MAISPSIVSNPTWATQKSPQKEANRRSKRLRSDGPPPAEDLLQDYPVRVQADLRDPQIVRVYDSHSAAAKGSTLWTVCNEAKAMLEERNPYAIIKSVYVLLDYNGLAPGREARTKVPFTPGAAVIDDAEAARSLGATLSDWHSMGKTDLRMQLHLYIEFKSGTGSLRAPSPEFLHDLDSALD